VNRWQRYRQRIEQDVTDDIFCYEELDTKVTELQVAWVKTRRMTIAFESKKMSGMVVNSLVDQSGML
jgi:hypothetical protein